MVIQVPEHQDHTFALGGSRFGSSLLEDGRSLRRLRYPSFSLVCLDPFVKISIVDMLKCTIHTRFMFGYWFFGFWFNRYLFS